MELTHRATITPPPDAELVDASVGPAGDLIALWRKGTTHLITGSAELGIANLDLAHPLVQPLSDGRVLLVGSRTRRKKSNALVFDANGDLVAEGSFGDGIAHVLTTSDDHVWVGYFDEGVYGDGGPGGHGLVRFDPELKPDWLFPFHQHPPIDDCYSLNVTDRAAWTCYYSSWSVVRVRHSEARRWHNETAGASALVVAGSSVALIGGYREDHSRVVIGYLDGEQLHVREQHALPLPDRCRLVGRGPDLHVLTEREWSTWSLV